MFRERIAIILTFMLLGIAKMYSQERYTTEICIDFRVNGSVIDSTYRDNSARLAEILSQIDLIHRDSTIHVEKLVFSGVSSPEGNYQVNKRLAGKRLKALEDFIRSHIKVSDRIHIERDDAYIRWEYLIEEVENSTLPHKEEVLTILRGESKFIPYINHTTIDSRIPALQKLDGGAVWRTLNSRYFSGMRNACAVIITRKSEPQPAVEPEPEPVVEPEPEPVVEPEPEPEPVPVVAAPEDPRHWYLKSNAIGWGMLIANVAAEVDLADHWSFALPVYYSAMNYFTSTVKFRTLCFQPEVRYWFSDENNGWFGGAHFGLAWFNYAKGGDWRYQDHHKNTPMLGGGLSGGYRKAISRDGRWLLEFSLGYGAYRLHYDIFHNEPNGRLVDTQKRTFYGIDHAAVTIAYRFDW